MTQEVPDTDNKKRKARSTAIQSQLDMTPPQNIEPSVIAKARDLENISVVEDPDTSRYIDTIRQDFPVSRTEKDKHLTLAMWYLGDFLSRLYVFDTFVDHTERTVWQNTLKDDLDLYRAIEGTRISSKILGITLQYIEIALGVAGIEDPALDKEYRQLYKILFVPLDKGEKIQSTYQTEYQEHEDDDEYKYWIALRVDWAVKRTIALVCDRADLMPPEFPPTREEAASKYKLFEIPSPMDKEILEPA